MKALNTIQKLSKIGKVLSTIIFVFCIVGAVLSVVGILCLAFIPEGFKIGEVTIRGLIESKANISVGTCYTSAALALIFCIGEAVLSKIAARYFKNEVAAGTPFTEKGANELKRLGICTIVIPIATAIVAAIVYAVMKASFKDVADLQFADYASIGLGVMFIFMSLLCRYGAYIENKKADEKAEEADTADAEAE